MRRPVKIVRLRYVQRMRARSDVCELFAKNVSPFAENVSLKHGVFAKNVSRIERCLWVQVITFVSRYTYASSAQRAGP